MIITIANIPSLIMSEMLIPRILPHNILIAVLLIAVSGIKFKKIRPSAMVEENIIPRIILGCNFALSVRGPKIIATVVENIKAIRSGLYERASPRAEPAKAACDIQKPKEVNFILTMKTSIKEHTMPAKDAPNKVIKIIFVGRRNSITV